MPERNAQTGERGGRDETTRSASRPEAHAAAATRDAFPVAMATGLGAGVALLMGAVLLYAAAAGDLAAEGAHLLALAWGQATLIEVYVGFGLFAVWIWRREPRAWVAGAWIVALCLMGNLVAGCYVVRATWGCGGCARRFWLGPSGTGGRSP